MRDRLRSNRVAVRRTITAAWFELLFGIDRLLPSPGELVHEVLLSGGLALAFGRLVTDAIFRRTEARANGETT